MNLYMVHVGFYDPSIGEGLYEVHMNFFTVAKNPKNAKEKILDLKEFKDKKPLFFKFQIIFWHFLVQF